MADDLLIPQDVYLKSGIHIGTKFKTKYMAPFIYKIRPDGLAILNLQRIDERLKLAANMMSHYDPKDIIVACKRENGWKPVAMFGKVTNVRTFVGRYPPGTLTNPKLKTYTEAKLIMIVDPWPDKNIMLDALNIGIPIIALCDSNNQTNGIDLVIPCNNKGPKSLGLIFYLLAEEFLKKKGIIKKDDDFKYKIEDFTPEE